MLAINQVLRDRYRIIRLLGSGGMGAVYEAEDNQRFGKPVALKEIHFDLTEKNSEHFRQMFEREAKILTHIDHEAVPKVFGYFQEGDSQILVMELVEGDDLDKILERRQKPFPLENVLNWTNQLLDALDYLHTLPYPIFHRDIKPQNLKLTSRGRVKLLDFGIAKDSSAEIGYTKSGKLTFIGATLYYSPIEQILRIPDYFEMLRSVYPEKAESIASQPADARTDIYALGATMYHLLTGQYPKPAHLRVLETLAGRPDSLKPLHELNAEVPEEISECLSKALEIERENRYVSVWEMQARLRYAIADENRRAEESARNLWLSEQEKFKREREELEAERRKLEEERRKLEEQRKGKFNRWEIENRTEKLFNDEQPAANSEITQILPPHLIPSTPELPQTFAYTESNSASFAEDFEIPPEKPAINTLENKSHTEPMSVPPPALPKTPVWIVPAAIFGFLFFGLAALGIFLMSGGNPSDSISNKSGKAVESVSPTVTPTATPAPSVAPTVSPAVSPTRSVSEKEQPKPTTAPVQNKTPQIQNPAKTPSRKTPMPVKTPDRSDNCIYNGKCRN